MARGPHVLESLPSGITASVLTGNADPGLVRCAASAGSLPREIAASVLDEGADA